MGRAHIVVIDDSEVWCELSQHVLENAGYSVSVITSVFGLSAALNERAPDLALIDVTMPALSGDKLIEVARRNELTRCKLVLHSDRPVAELARLAQTSGADGFIQKAAGASTLVSEVDRLLRLM